MNRPLALGKWLGVALLLALIAPAVARQPSTQAAPPTIEFLNRDAGTKAIIDESMEPYFKLLQPMEMSVKTAEPIGDGTLNQQRDRCRQRYQKAVENFTPQEQETLNWYLAKLRPLVTKYPLYARTPWSFIKLSSDFEGGMPHTRGAHIVLCERFLQELANVKSQAPEWLALAQMGDILLHEQSHVVQRENPAQFATLYTGLWKFKHATAVEGCLWLTQHQIINPDGVDIDWVYDVKEGTSDRWIWPLVVFGDVDDAVKASFADMQMVAVELVPIGENSFKARLAPDGKPVMRNLMAVKQYVSAFRPSHNIYHPNEAAADLFAKEVVLTRLMPDHVPPTGAGQLQKRIAQLAPLNEWFEKILALPG